MAGQPDAEAPVHSIFAERRGGPTALRMLLGAQLRRLRIARKMTCEEAARAIWASRSKISRIELGRVALKERDVADLLTAYGVTGEEERAALLMLAQQSNAPDWWHSYYDILPNWFEFYLGLEEAVSQIRAYEVQFVPGLLQTEDYARAVTLLGNPRAPAAEVQRRVDLRMARQGLLTGAEPPLLWAVIDEAALSRPIGSVEVMRRQLSQLIDVAELPNVTLQVLPFRLGGHAGTGGSFSILRFTEPDLPDVVYLEQLTSALYLDKPADVDSYMAAMTRLCLQADPPEATAETLAMVLKAL